MLWCVHEHLKSDSNWDGLVNMMDMARVAKLFGSRLGDEGENPTVDLDKNEVINLKDIATSAR